jgi:hypothetical protein
MAKYQVIVTSISREKVVPLIKSLRAIGDLGLKNAKELSEFISATKPCTLVAGIDREVADHVVKLLEEAGAAASVEESSLSVPLLLCPEANQKYRWSWLAGRVPAVAAFQQRHKRFRPHLLGAAIAIGLGMVGMMISSNPSISFGVVATVLVVGGSLWGLATVFRMNRPHS